MADAGTDGVTCVAYEQRIRVPGVVVVLVVVCVLLSRVELT